MNVLPRGSQDAVSVQQPVLPSATGRCKSLARGVMMALAVLHVLSSASAGPTTLALPSETGPTQAVELDQASRGLADVQSRSRVSRSATLSCASSSSPRPGQRHPDLLPPHALFAKLAFLGNQGALIRPALERAVVEDGGHPEVFILFGNLALAEGRLTDAAVHFEKATALAAAPPVVGRAAGSLRSALPPGQRAGGRKPARLEGRAGGAEAWLTQEPWPAQARQRLG